MTAHATLINVEESRDVHQEVFCSFFAFAELGFAARAEAAASKQRAHA